MCSGLNFRWVGARSYCGICGPLAVALSLLFTLEAAARQSTTDCNNNGIADSQDIASGFSQDCNTNGLPDECEDDSVASTTGNMGAFYWQHPATGILAAMRQSTTPVVIRISARGDLDAPTEFITLKLNGVTIGNFFVQDGVDCDQTNVKVTTISSTLWSTILAAGSNDVGVQIVASPLVDPDCVVPPRDPLPGTSEVSVSYGGVNYDCNGNGIADICDIAGGAADCNENRKLDQCEIASGSASDCDKNGVPDECEVDSDGDGAIDACDGCPSDPLKTEPGICGCGVPDTDTDRDGTADCKDLCPTDPFKIAPGICGCGVPDTDTDRDGTADCIDGCPSDPLKIAPGICGCGVPDTESDGDGTANCIDGCPSDPLKIAPGVCGCGIPDTDTDGDGIANCIDNCPAAANPDQLDCNGNGIGDLCEVFSDCNGNSIPDSCDIASGSSTDLDADGVPDECALDCNENSVVDVVDIATGTSEDCNSNHVPDECENSTVAQTTGNMGAFYWQHPAIGVLQSMQRATTPVVIRVSARGDLDAPTEFVTLKLNGMTIGNFFVADGLDCDETNVASITIGSTLWNSIVGSGSSDVSVQLVASPLVDSDCVVPPRNPLPGTSEVSVTFGGVDYDCNGNGIPDICDIADGAADCNQNHKIDQCELAAGLVDDCDKNGIPDECELDSDEDGLIDACDGCPHDPLKSDPGQCGCGTPDTDTDNDGTANCNDGCPLDPLKIAPGICGCGVADTDTDNDGTADCLDNCPTTANPDQLDCNGNEIGDLCEDFADCNGNSIPDECDISGGASDDKNSDGIPDECALDCNGNGVVDVIDIASGTSTDCNDNDVPDECEDDSVASTTGDMGACYWQHPATGSLAGMRPATTSVTIQISAVGDLDAPTEYVTLRLNNRIVGTFFAQDDAECGETSTATVTIGSTLWNEIVAAGTGSAMTVKVTAAPLVEENCTVAPADPITGFCEVSVAFGGVNYDCNGNGIPDICDIGDGAPDCNGNGKLDSCEITAGIEQDCNSNAIPDSCDLANGTSSDVDGNSVPDECKSDCNANGLPDAWEILTGLVPDCNTNAVPDSCDIATGFSNDIDADSIPDECALDCNQNGVPDAYEIARRLVPDCNSNKIPDSCDIATDSSQDCNANDIPDECDIANGDDDADGDGVPDSCEYAVGDFNLDGIIGAIDLMVLFSAWGLTDVPAIDINGDGIVNAPDMTYILSNWTR